MAEALVEEELATAETPEEVEQAVEDAIVVAAAAEVVEEAAEEFVAEHEPELGLSDDVFPAGAAADDEAADDEAATEEPTEA